MKSVAVVGASLAGYSTAEALRQQGFDGRLVLIGDERRMPYDRPPLSKEFLTGEPAETDLALAADADLDALEAEWLLGRVATRLDPARGGVFLADGTLVEADGVVIATGASPIMLPGEKHAHGVHLLRTVDDALALRAELHTGSPRVVIVGGGFIGAEVASSAVSLGLDVTIVEAAPLPLAGVLGTEMARHCAQLHADHGVTLRCGAGVSALSTQDGRVTGVRLADGTELPADVVVIGIGARPNTRWLAGSGLTADDGVVCDTGCVTSNPAVVAVGDVARLRGVGERTGVRHEHWTSASTQGDAAARNLLAGETIADATGVPYFWSDQYGVRIQVAGESSLADEVTIVDGSAADKRFVAQYRQAGEVVGVLSFNNPRAFAKARRSLATTPLTTTAH